VGQAIFSPEASRRAGTATRERPAAPRLAVTDATRLRTSNGDDASVCQDGYQAAIENSGRLW
jgi:hypothetical protein